MECPAEVLRLVERFDLQLDAYRSGRYNETQVRREFIDPLLKAVGWDIDNEQGYAEAYKEVVHEDAIKVGAATKAPDYCFRIGGTRKFFLEAKKPSVNVKDDIAAAFQLRRYAWSAKLPLSILTDFEEFAVYDCRVKPEKLDKASTARILYLTFDQYAHRWEDIAGVFSRESILRGSFDRYAESTKGKKGTAEVDATFLKEIEEWRDLLARTIALRNPGVTQHELNFAVQTTIDRIIFLRICEDRGIENYGELQSLCNGTSTYARLLETFQKADRRYNSGLFHFERERGRGEAPDTLTPSLVIDDKPLKDILRRLYYPDSPYEFSVLPADILGQVYEQFLGKVIRLTAGHRAVVEDKPEVKKAGGVYYTPTYIVDYIVKHTVGRLLEGSTPKKASGLRILDPACGSGSFLIGAFQYLIDWHRDWYVEDGPKKHAKEIFLGPGREWRLTTAEKKRILLNNIYGVDIDSQAVETTKLSLLLKVLEGETQETINAQLSFLHERALPDLANNVKCGNSLIGPEFYHSQPLELLTPEEQYRVNIFHWEHEFPAVFRGEDPGFAAVIGNPPYVRIQALREWAPTEADFYKSRFTSAQSGSYDIYVLFVERALGLLAQGGRLSFILPHKFFNSQYGKALRALIAEGRHLLEVVHFGDQQVFAGATTYTCLMFLGRAASSRCQVSRVTDLAAWRANGEAVVGELSAADITTNEWNFVVGRGAGLFQRLSDHPHKLKDVVDGMFVGQQTSADTVYVFEGAQAFDGADLAHLQSKALGEPVAIERGILRPVVRSGDIGRYQARSSAFVLFPYTVAGREARLLSPGELESSYPLAWAYLGRNKALLEGREKGKFRGPEWYRFGRHQNVGMWEQPKIMVPYMATRLAAFPALRENLYFINVTTGGYGLTVDDGVQGLLYLTALLNSQVLDWYFKQVSTNFHGGYFAANKQFIEQLPVVPLGASGSLGPVQTQLVNKAEDITSLYQRLAAASTEHDRNVVQRQIASIDSQIEELIYELFGLSDEDIGLVERATHASPSIAPRPG